MHALEGVTYSTLSHGEGWYFLELANISSGRSCWPPLDVHFRGPRDGSQNTPKYFDWLVLLKFCTAFEPYTKLYTASIRPQKIAEFLSLRSGISPFHPLFGGPDDRCLGPGGAGGAAGPTRGGGTAGGPPESQRGFRPDR